MSFRELTIYIEEKECQFYRDILSDINLTENAKFCSFKLVTDLASLSLAVSPVAMIWQDEKIFEKQKILLEEYPSIPYILLSENLVEGDNLTNSAHPTRLFLVKQIYSREILRLMLDFAERFISDMQQSFEFDLNKGRLSVLENIFEEFLDILIQIDPSTKFIIGINKQALNALGYIREELIGKDFSILVPKGMVTEEAEFEGSLIAGNGIVTKTGEIIPTESSFRLFPTNGKMAIWATFRDITERKHAQEQVKVQKAYYEFILDNIDSDISVLDYNFKYEYSNPVLVPNLEVRKWLFQKTDYDFALKMHLPPDFSEKRTKYLEIAKKNHEIVQFEEIIQDINDDRKYLLRKYIPIEDPITKQRRIISYGIDITERKLSEEKITYLAYYDALTGLSNRTLFIDHSAQALKNHKDDKTFLAFYFFDIDNFKFINDTLGHAKGDMLLQMVGARLKRLLLEVDTVARFGGDEFAVLKIDITNKGQAAEFGQKILEILTQPFHITGRDLFITISMGIALSPNDGVLVHELLKNADMAMYKAKDLGRNNYRFYTKELIERSEKRLNLENSLRKALPNSEFSLFFQPQISMETEKVCGAEALLRWNHPERGWVSPTEFIPVAEDSGIIERIGDWVLEEACRHKKLWREEGLVDFNVSINVSGKQLKRNNWAEKVQTTLEHFHIKPSEIELELTESSIMENPERSIEAFRYLSGLGVTVSIDDFGTGYSSLSYLKKIDADILKIDRSFVTDLEINEDDQAICRAIINMAVSLGMKVIAEGVETEIQRNLLKSFGCHIIQGYFYSQPLPVNDFVAFFRKINQ